MTVPAPSPRASVAAIAHRWLVVLVLGFASGLPLALTGMALQAWLTIDGLDLAQIGFLSLIGLPYTFKFLWAPLMDRVDLPLLGRRRGWAVLSQALLALALLGLAGISPQESTPSSARRRTWCWTPTAPTCCRRASAASARRCSSPATASR
jgi:PAT family beta-lactamase induction signal transducer AmpG